MTKERLLSVSMEELERIAISRGLSIREDLSKSALVDSILETLEEVKRERDEQNNLPIRGEKTKFIITEDEEFDTVKQDEYPIPERYNETKVVFMVRDPNWAFAYWDIEDQNIEKIKLDSGFDQLILRVHNLESAQFNNSNSNSSFDIPIQFHDRSWYIYLPYQNCSYVLELAYLSKGKCHILSRSNKIKTPGGSLADIQDPDDEDTSPRLTESESFKSHSSREIIPQRIISRGRE